MNRQKTLVAGQGLLLAALLLTPAWLSAQQYDSQAILEPIDSLVSYPENDFSAEYSITQVRPGEGNKVTRAYMFRRDRDDKYLILITEPEVDRGTGYLKIGNVLWLYDPADRRFNTTSARDRFQNSNARNSDFTQSTLAKDYQVVSASTGRLGAYTTDIYELEATNTDVTFPGMKIWVDQDGLLRKFEDYSLSGQHMRTTAIPTYQRIGQKYVPISIVIVDELAGRTINGEFRNERTIISVTRPSFGQVPDIVFTQAYLERVSR